MQQLQVEQSTKMSMVQQAVLSLAAHEEVFNSFAQETTANADNTANAQEVQVLQEEVEGLANALEENEDNAITNNKGVEESARCTIDMSLV